MRLGDIRLCSNYISIKNDHYIRAVLMLVLVMLDKWIGFSLLIVALYLVIGLLFSIFFLISGLNKVDEDAQNTNWKFKALILPGLLVFWPVFLLKWKKLK